ncbi:magnesium transporter NIPA-domain-containing protein [Pseudomassariella vexata]|uniref:Magnesium transporter NIPA-domain-containing protein n=1 Tax=Pseudomassariella vexata TaxID=1141098 RepID=A0A1Y2DG00_9PEZI|nr:magnesium transporter NIPA-domain-containing protein [Pseudomassariella vexata]ORY58036.1 magnesium transporter NIPA-domain-containing protein [Pseudomassariella vexata]
MNTAAQALEVAHNVYARANETSSTDATTQERPPIYKVIGISLAIASGLFIGTSFVLKKVGLLKANDKYNEVAGEGYGYFKNVYWWSGMILMIIGEICNFVAYAFTDAILVTPLGALSVVITTVLSAIFLKERLSMVGKVSCFLCIVGSVVIVMNAPEESSVANIQEMQKFVIAPGFLSYTGVILIGSAITAYYAGPRWGKKNMLVYISICSWIGGLSVVATQGLGSAIVAQVQGTSGNQFKQWFLYVLFVFVIGTLLTEIIFLNKALNLFNAAMVTPTYYVYFTSTTIVTSAVLFQGFKGTASSIITVVMGFLTICSGVVLLQLSKSAKDVPDVAVFKGDLDQIQTIAEQEQPETEPKADAIRGTAAIVRRISLARQKMEAEELKRLHEEKERERLATVSEDGTEQYEWDGLRRRRTTLLRNSQRSRAMTSPNPFNEPERTPHPPLGMSHWPDEEEQEEDETTRQRSPGLLSSIAGTIRSRTRSVILPGHPDFRDEHDQHDPKARSPMHPVQLTDIAIPSQTKLGGEASPYGAEHVYGLPDALRHQKTEYGGAASIALGAASIASGSTGRRIQFGELYTGNASSTSLSVPPTPPPHKEGQSARRQFSFQNVFRRHQADTPQDLHQPGSLKPSSRGGMGSRGYASPQVKNATEEERLGLVKGDSNSMPVPPPYGGGAYLDDEEDATLYLDDKRASRYGRGITGSPPRQGSVDSNGSYGSPDRKAEAAEYEASRRRWDHSRSQSRETAPKSSPPRPAPGRRTPPEGPNGSFM